MKNFEKMIAGMMNPDARVELEGVMDAITVITKLLDEKDARIDGLEKKLSETSERLDSITESVIRSAGEAVINLQERVTEMEEREENMRNTLMEHEDAIAELEEE
jgi:prefoldin subunit 5